MSVSRSALALSAGIVVLAVLSLHVGLEVYPPATVWDALGGGDLPGALIVSTLRVPRTLVAVVAGAALALSGLLMQGATDNPLAEPGLLGINAGAAFAVVLGLVLFGSVGLAEIGLLALAGALVATALVFGLTLAAGPAAGRSTILLAGVTIAAMLASLTQVVLLLDETALETLLFWLSGGFADRALPTLAIGLPCLSVGALGAALVAPALDALRADEDSARSIGVAVGRTRLSALGLAALLAGGAVAMAGPVAFVGLVAPHMARRLPLGATLGGTPGHGTLALLSALLGALVSLLADIVARLVVAPGEAPISSVLALVGVPVLIALLRRGRTA